jgi:hypothetical protein
MKENRVMRTDNLRVLGMKTLIATLIPAMLTAVSPGIGFSEMVITTHDGKILRVPVNNRDIQKIEFTRETAALSLDGRWNSSIGFQYDITQSGKNFTWNVITPVREQGRGTLSGNNVTASWSGDNGSGSAEGRITESDSQGRAQRIEWSNGVVFFR